MARSYAAAGTTSFMPTFGTTPFNWYKSEMGSLEVGKSADFILLNKDKENIRRVYVKGVAV